MAFRQAKADPSLCKAPPFVYFRSKLPPPATKNATIGFPMLNVERRTKILELLEKQGQVAVIELSRRFKTSEVTIRNDLKDLHARGLIRRAHGGAVKVANVSMDPSLKIKAELHAEEKRRIGAAAAS